jgi:superfamily II DNA or RNA helicase
LHCSGLHGQLYFWGHGAGRGITESLRALGLQSTPRRQELKNTVVWLPDKSYGSLEPMDRKALPCPWPYWWYIYDNARFQRSGDHSYALGDDFRYWLTVTQFAERLLVEGAFLPGIVRVERTWRSIWEPFCLGPNRDTFKRLVEFMPDSARALSFSRHDIPAVPRRDLLAELLGEMVNSGARLASAREQRWASAGSYGRWLSSLFGPFETLQGEPSVLARLERDLAYWKGGIQAEAETGATLKIRLVEPDEAIGDWRIDVRWVSASRGETGFDDLPEEEASVAWRLAEEAARVYPQLLALGQSQWLGATSLLGDEVVGFMDHWAALLQDAGFAVEAPACFEASQRKAIRLEGRIRSGKAPSDTRFSLDALVELDWSISVDENLLGLDEIAAMAERRTSLHKVGDKWVVVDRGSVEAAAQFLRRQRDKQMKMREALRMALGLVPVDASIEWNGVKADGWVKALLHELSAGDKVRALPPPTELHGELRPYQLRGYSWLSFLTKFGLGACLADDMGLGKSIQTLALFLERKPGQKTPALLICPTSVIGNWQREAQRFAPSLRVLVHHGATRTKSDKLLAEIQDYDVVIASYALAYRDEKLLRPIEWDGLVLDEAQNIKNSEAKQSVAIRSFNAGYKIALTGTPVENHVGDLFSLMQFLNPGHLGGSADFKRRFQQPIQKRGDAVAGTLLKKLTAPFLLRRLKTDRAIIADLPEKLEMKVFCKLTKEQARLYDEVVRQQFAQISQQKGMARRGSILATLLKLKQVCNHPSQLLRDGGAVAGRSGKLLRLEEMLEEVRENGEKALVFSQFSEMGEILRKHLHAKFNEPVNFLFGGTKREKRDQMVESFNDPQGPGIFVLSLKAGGTGLNLTAATHVFHFDRWWNPAVENQATDRAYRIGQTKQVEVHKMLTMGTLEERIDLMLEHKKQLAEKIVDGAETWLTEMSNDELRELFALSEDALAG